MGILDPDGDRVLCRGSHLKFEAAAARAGRELRGQALDRDVPGDARELRGRGVAVSRAVLQREAGFAQGRVDPNRLVGGETVAIEDQVESSFATHDVQPLPQAILRGNGEALGGLGKAAAVSDRAEDRIVGDDRGGRARAPQ